MSPTSLGQTVDLNVRPLQERDLADAGSIFRLAFGTFLKVPDPATWCADREYIYTRWRANPNAALVAEVNGSVAGSNFAVNWGSFGYFGPLTVRPDLWDRGIARRLLAPTVDLFDQLGARASGLFTFPHSAKHVALYQKFGYWPRFLTALMSKDPSPQASAAIKYSTLSSGRRSEVLAASKEVTGSFYDGLDVSSEIHAVSEQNLGDTVLLWGGDVLEAFAVCHCGEGTEAGANVCYIKFGAVRSMPAAGQAFERLLASCEALAVEKGLGKMSCGVNTARSQAYRRMLQLGWRTAAQGVAMLRPDAEAYNRADVFAVDGWR